MKSEVNHLFDCSKEKLTSLSLLPLPGVAAKLVRRVRHAQDAGRAIVRARPEEDELAVRLGI